MQPLDHDTVRRMIAEREVAAAHARLTRTLARANARTTSRTLARGLGALLLASGRRVSALGRGSAHRRSPAALRTARCVTREGAPRTAVAPLRAASRGSAAPVGCV